MSWHNCLGTNPSPRWNHTRDLHDASKQIDSAVSSRQQWEHNISTLEELFHISNELIMDKPESSSAQAKRGLQENLAGAPADYELPW